jgi:hypothetical protein
LPSNGNICRAVLLERLSDGFINLAFSRHDTISTQNL